MAIINIHEAKTQLSRLVEQAAAGDEIVIAKSGKPKARLVPLTTPPSRVPGAFKKEIQMSDDFFEPLPEDELSAWESGEAGN